MYCHQDSVNVVHELYWIGKVFKKNVNKYYNITLWSCTYQIWDGFYISFYNNKVLTLEIIYFRFLLGEPGGKKWPSWKINRSK